MISLFHTDALSKLRSLPDNSIDMVLTDPPYGTTACKWDSVIPFDELWAELNRVTKEDGAQVLFASQPFTWRLIASNGKNFKYTWTWKKSTATAFALAKKQPLRCIEDICVFYRKQCLYQPIMRTGFKPYNRTRKAPRGTDLYSGLLKDGATISNGERYPIHFLEYPKPRGTKSLHPSQKPTDLLEYLIKTYTRPGETVLDFTMGSGSTGVACVNTGRQFIGVELDEKYFNLASDRIKDHQLTLELEALKPQQPELFPEEARA